MELGTLRHNGLILTQEIKGLMAMDRQEAASVLREILGECDGSLLMNCVSLSPIAPNRMGRSSFELRINCGLDDYLRKCIDAVLDRHKLAMKELGDKVVIYRPT
jgi:hypothetical protein